MQLNCLNAHEERAFGHACAESVFITDENVTAPAAERVALTRAVRNGCFHEAHGHCRCEQVLSAASDLNLGLTEAVCGPQPATKNVDAPPTHASTPKVRPCRQQMREMCEDTKREACQHMLTPPLCANQRKAWQWQRYKTQHAGEGDYRDAPHGEAYHTASAQTPTYTRVTSHATPPAAGKVAIHVMAIFPNIDHATFAGP